MPRRMNLLRGMLVTGIAFGVGAGLLTLLIGLPFWLIAGSSLRGLLRAAARFSVASCVIGIIFSGLVALTARGRRLDRLSLLHFAGLGAGVGTLYFLFMGFTGAFTAWSLASAITNLVIVTVTGAGSATALLLLARRGRPALRAGEDTPSHPES
jgi:hypothetical protein